MGNRVAACGEVVRRGLPINHTLIENEESTEEQMRRIEKEGGRMSKYFDLCCGAETKFRCGKWLKTRQPTASSQEWIDVHTWILVLVKTPRRISLHGLQVQEPITTTGYLRQCSHVPPEQKVTTAMIKMPACIRRTAQRPWMDAANSCHLSY